MESSLRVVVTGLIAQYPLGGLTWHYLQYVLGLARLGHDVYYVEDSGQWPYNPIEVGGGQNCTYNVNYLAGVMSRFGLAEKWSYHFPGGVLPSGRVLESQCFGLTETETLEILGSADLLINISSGFARPGHYHRLPRLAFIDSDPVFTQVRLAEGEVGYCKLVDAHDVHFSFGECLSEAVPATGHHWRPTRQPIMLSEWQLSVPRHKVFTTVMNWASYKPLTYDGQTYGHKDVEFKKFVNLPRMVGPALLEVAISAGEARRLSHTFLADLGWRVVEAAAVSASIDTYREYLQLSMAEWSVAKNGYVVGRPGWFSERSACYLAAGRPVVVQDTGFGAIFPVGKGILAFQTIDEAADAIREVTGNYAMHGKAARAIAEEYFNSDKVLSRLIEDAMK